MVQKASQLFKLWNDSECLEVKVTLLRLFLHCFGEILWDGSLYD